MLHPLRYFSLGAIFAITFFATPLFVSAQVTNPSFELGNSAWQCTGADCPLYITDYAALAYGGSHYAAIFGDTSISQDITLPKNADRLGIVFHYWLNGEINSSVRLKVIDRATGEVYLNKRTSDAYVGTMYTQSYLLPDEAMGRNVRIKFDISGEVYLDVIKIQRTLPYAAIRAYISSWAGKNDLSYSRITVFDGDGTQLRLKNLKTDVKGKSILTNAAGATPLFRILGVRSNNESFELCAKKSSVYGCTAIQPPMAGREYSINYSPDYD